MSDRKAVVKNADMSGENQENNTQDGEDEKYIIHVLGKMILHFGLCSPQFTERRESGIVMSRGISKGRMGKG